MSETRYRHPYEGAPRTRGKGREPKGGRAFAAPPAALRWMMADQSTAIERGYFLERVTFDNHVRVIPLRGGDDSAVIAMLTLATDAHASKALAFIKQQDQFGYSGVWEPCISRWTATLRWYKQAKQAQRIEGMRRGAALTAAKKFRKSEK